MRLRPLALLAATLVLAPGAAAGQQVRFTGRGDYRLDRFLRTVLASPTLSTLAADTLIARNDTLAGPVLVLRATVRVEGVIQGDLVIVDANVFLRPSARVSGDVTNLAGGYFPAPGAIVAGTLRDEPDAPYLALREPGGIRITGTVHRSLLVPEGFRGVLLPTYDRVDGVSPGLGVGYLPPRLGAAEPFLRGRVRYQSQRGTVNGGAEVGVQWSQSELAAGAERTTATQDAWIRGDLHNSLSVLYDGRDYRNYYDADRLYARWRLERDQRPWSEAFELRLVREHDRSLSAAIPWSIFKADSLRPNPAVHEEDIAAAALHASLHGEGSRWTTEVGGTVEWASRVAGGDDSFARFELQGEWALPAFANHTIRVRARVRGPLPGTDSLPHQRWNLLGGAGTLETYGIGVFGGDRLAFIETTYLVPLPESLHIPVLGYPEIEAIHRAGMAWTRDAPRDLEQNVGLRLRFPLINFRVFINPRNPQDQVVFSVDVNGPRHAYPWERTER